MITRELSFEETTCSSSLASITFNSGGGGGEGSFPLPLYNVCLQDQETTIAAALAEVPAGNGVLPYKVYRQHKINVE